MSTESITLPPLPILTRAFRSFDKRIGESTLTEGMRDLLDKTAGLENISIKGLEGETRRILEEEGVLLVCNHPHDAESIILLGTMPPRDDVSIIAAHNQMRLGRNMAAHILPVYPYRQEQTTSNLKLSVRLAKKFTSPPYPQEEMDRRNHATISLAAAKTSEGELVALFPEGVSGKSGKWRKGIGHLVSQIEPSKPVYFAMAHVKGTSDWDSLRVIPGLRNIMRKGSISFARPELFSSFNLPQNPNDITEYLQGTYSKWVNTLA